MKNISSILESVIDDYYKGNIDGWDELIPELEEKIEDFNIFITVKKYENLNNNIVIESREMQSNGREDKSTFVYGYDSRGFRLMRYKGHPDKLIVEGNIAREGTIDFLKDKSSYGTLQSSDGTLQSSDGTLQSSDCQGSCPNPPPSKPPHNPYGKDKDCFCFAYTLIYTLPAIASANNGCPAKIFLRKSCKDNDYKFSDIRVVVKRGTCLFFRLQHNGTLMQAYDNDTCGDPKDDEYEYNSTNFVIVTLKAVLKALCLFNERVTLAYSVLWKFKDSHSFLIADECFPKLVLVIKCRIPKCFIDYRKFAFKKCDVFGTTLFFIKLVPLFCIGLLGRKRRF